MLRFQLPEAVWTKLVQMAYQIAGHEFHYAMIAVTMHLWQISAHARVDVVCAAVRLNSFCHKPEPVPFW